MLTLYHYDRHPSEHQVSTFVKYELFLSKIRNFELYVIFLFCLIPRFQPNNFVTDIKYI